MLTHKLAEAQGIEEKTKYRQNKDELRRKTKQNKKTLKLWKFLLSAISDLVVDILCRS